MTCGVAVGIGCRLFVWLLVSLAVLASAGCRVQKAAESGGGDSLVGILYVTGNEPFTRLSLQTADGVMHPINKDSSKTYSDLWKLQGKKVEVFCRPVLRKSQSPSLIIERYRVVEDR